MAIGKKKRKTRESQIFIRNKNLLRWFKRDDARRCVWRGHFRFPRQLIAADCDANPLEWLLNFVHNSKALPSKHVTMFAAAQLSSQPAAREQKAVLSNTRKKMSRRAKSRRFLLLLPFVRAKMSRALMQFSPKWILNWSCWNMCVELLLFRCQRHDLRVAKAKAHDDDERPEKYFN